MISKNFNKNQFSHLSIPFIFKVPIGIRPIPKIIRTKETLILQYEKDIDEFFLVDFINHCSYKKRLVVSLNLIHLLNSLEENLVVDFSPENFLINKNLNLRFIHLGVNSLLIPESDPDNDFLRMKNLIIYILSRQKTMNKNSLTPYLNINKFEKAIYKSNSYQEIVFLISKKLRIN